MIRLDPHFRKFCETEKFILGHIYECAYLVTKKNGKKIGIGDFYGDPYCGLIDLENNWCLVGGSTLYAWTTDRGPFEIKDEELSWISKVRQKSVYEAEILIDPWSDKGSVWRLDIITLQKHKERDFRLTGEYSDRVLW